MLKKSMMRKLMLKKLGMILLATSIATLLSSCLVDKSDDVEKLFRKTDTLRIYKDGEYIDYTVDTVIDGSTIQQGILRIKWENTADLTDPIDPSIRYPVLKETTTLTYDDDPTNPTVSTRYISQVTEPPVNAGDPGIGSIILHAIDDHVDHADYWPYAPGTATTPDSPVITPVIIESPLAISPNSPQSFSVMELECVSGKCNNEIYLFRDNIFEVVGDSREITTHRGIFIDPFEISFQGESIPAAAAPDIEFLGDIRDACGNSKESTTHNGNMFIIPEIGMIQMTNICQNSGSNTSYAITLFDTSFAF